MLPADITESVQRALAEDLGSGDLSAALVDPRQELQARVISREAGVLCGQPYFEAVCIQLSADLRVNWNVSEGAEIVPNQPLCDIHGPAAALLSAERSALNFLQLLSATATQTRAFVERLRGSSTRLLDTRKTLPGLRLAQKYAVRVGGGYNHRLGLFDGILIKENHLAAIGGIAPAIARARALAPVLTRIEVEVETLEQLDEAVAAGADMVLLDNFSVPALREAVARVAGRIPLEASGNISLDTVAAVAATGVDYLSVGSITRNVQSLDLSLRYL
ncbi:carboxylating nicotinate-nucleotide diphosphorylase [Acidithiobacillus sp. CV18-2]|uniref:nicotinate-nucleotide diphosphorylase (carboxylating) n=1 Tax=Igneacidithiobacillus copahuensis TaxID=2724909 RepID=A0AAE2YSJ0_9PROT|nr:carboxylating nicotinate-nucleotide diphosphorylase [Igneacidithiobacillus copahuensis]MBU2753404.1 carboxylating nicotinate-nucleotide diphosphorylase [Acidithiobacillus sp. CV18-3]MBU2756434.1 carboxylating nicotinate-nucleotide diphosphorylase [Acidithiobacillus sp. BN09-2]MBU2776221.1 carboxylating nicotinate-nucleotide diphosphorylase [Acidithiobacillus sp. CV18-2]MBU2795651.1 carboxylating nicotinate-nucleotide diphosphorylase [Acidithiobacillus sp. VAN18-2]MBU2798349.1 carboxylating 